MNDIGMILQRVAKKLATDVAPKLEGDYAAGDIRLGSILMAMAGETWDGEVDRIYREIKSMCEILSLAGEKYTEQPENFRIKQLRKLHDQLSSQLIELQIRLEESDRQKDKDLNTQIWKYYLFSAMERMPSPPALE